MVYNKRPLIKIHQTSGNNIINNFQDKANFIWTVADDILRRVFKAHEYGDVILPLVVLRWLYMVLEEHEDLQAVLRADNPIEVVRYKFNQVLDQILLEFVHTKLDL